MKKWIALTMIGASLAVALPAQARNVKYMLPIAPALEGSAVTADAVKVYFGPQKHPAVAQKYGTANATGKASINNKADIPSCNNAFLQGVQQLQKNARDVGANAVVNVVTHYKNDPEVSSATEFECRAGSFSTILMLKGDLVKVADH